MESYKLMNGVPNGNRSMNGNGSQTENRSMKRKKLEPISSSVNIYDLRKLMGSWKQAGITYAQMLKVLRLYLGETGWMDGYLWQISLQQSLSDSQGDEVLVSDGIL